MNPKGVEKTAGRNTKILQDRAALERIALELGEAAQLLVAEADDMPAAFQLAKLSSKILGLSRDLGKVAGILKR